MVWQPSGASELGAMPSGTVWARVVAARKSGANKVEVRMLKALVGVLGSVRETHNCVSGWRGFGVGGSLDYTSIRDWRKRAGQAGMARIEHSGTVIKSKVEEVGCDQPRDYLFGATPARLCRLGWQLLEAAKASCTCSASPHRARPTRGQAAWGPCIDCNHNLYR